jgi:hypothetical protein
VCSPQGLAGVLEKMPEKEKAAQIKKVRVVALTIMTIARIR